MTQRFDSRLSGKGLFRRWTDRHNSCPKHTGSGSPVHPDPPARISRCLHGRALLKSRSSHHHHQEDEMSFYPSDLQPLCLTAHKGENLIDRRGHVGYRSFHLGSFLRLHHSANTMHPSEDRNSVPSNPYLIEITPPITDTTSQHPSFREVGQESSDILTL
jgi:hypothetical protein